MIPKLKREAIAIASGNQVFAYSYSGNVMKLAERDGEVLSLTMYRGQLIDSGDYDGVRDTLTGETTAGKGAKWRRIAGHKTRTATTENERIEEELYGAMETTDEELFGIYELDIQRLHPRAVEEHSKRYHRNGRTDVLSSWFISHIGSGLLVDGGEYYYYTSGKTDDLCVRFSYDFDESLGCGPRAQPVTAFTSIGEWYCYSLPIQIKAVQRWKDRRMTLFKFKGGITDTLYELTHLWLEKEKPNDWQIFCNLLKKLKLKIPSKYFTYEEKCEIREIQPTDQEPTDSWQRSHLIHHMHDNLSAYIRDHEGISALAFADNVLFAGCRGGRLLLADEKLQDEGKHVAHEFKYPINAMCTIDEETMESGIRQRITRNIQMRAVHAKSRQAVMRRAA